MRGVRVSAVLLCVLGVGCAAPEGMLRSYYEQAEPGRFYYRAGSVVGSRRPQEQLPNARGSQVLDWTNKRMKAYKRIAYMGVELKDSIGTEKDTPDTNNVLLEFQVACFRARYAYWCEAVYRTLLYDYCVVQDIVSGLTPSRVRLLTECGGIHVTAEIALYLSATHAFLVSSASVLYEYDDFTKEELETLIWEQFRSKYGLRGRPRVSEAVGDEERLLYNAATSAAARYFRPVKTKAPRFWGTGADDSGSDETPHDPLTSSPVSKDPVFNLLHGWAGRLLALMCEYDKMCVNCGARGPNDALASTFLTTDYRELLGKLLLELEQAADRMLLGPTNPK